MRWRRRRRACSRSTDPGEFCASPGGHSGSYSASGEDGKIAIGTDAGRALLFDARTRRPFSPAQPPEDVPESVWRILEEHVRPPQNEEPAPVYGRPVGLRRLLDSHNAFAFGGGIGGPLPPPVVGRRRASAPVQGPRPAFAERPKHVGAVRTVGFRLGDVYSHGVDGLLCGSASEAVSTGTPVARSAGWIDAAHAIFAVGPHVCLVESLHGTTAQRVRHLSGHMGRVTCVGGVDESLHEHPQFISGGADGLVIRWGPNPGLRPRDL